MNSGRTVFAQLMDFLPLGTFRNCVSRYRGEYKVQSFSCLDQFLAMAFAQLTGRESLRDIEAGLRAVPSKLYHMGFRGRISRNTLAHANETRDWHIYADFAQELTAIARELYAGSDFAAELETAVYALDATTIRLCLSLFPWAHWRAQQAAVKMHTLLEVSSDLPVFVRLTPAKVHEVNILDELTLEWGAFYLLDRGYLDFARLYAIHQAGAFFITRAKSNMACRRRYSKMVDKTTGLRCDQMVLLKSFYPLRDYPEPLRRIRLYDSETGKTLVFLTNHTGLPALTITQLYRQRWRIELFFKWTKGHLRIKKFYGTSENAVQTQIWIALCVYLLVAILKKRLCSELKPYKILQILSLTLYEKVPVYQLFSDYNSQNYPTPIDNQLSLFEL